MDFIERLPKSDGKEIILVLVDRFSKYSHFMALVHPHSAYSMAKMFMDNAYKLHGLLATIMSDKNPIFVDQFCRQLFKHSGVNLHYSTTYHSQFDG